MGKLASSVREAGGKVVGVIPESDVQGQVAGDTRVVADTHERKAAIGCVHRFAGGVRCTPW
jgi:predicted Rossmann-fold nucleotide-binding protein